MIFSRYRDDKDEKVERSLDSWVIAIIVGLRSVFALQVSATLTTRETGQSGGEREDVLTFRLVFHPMPIVDSRPLSFGTIAHSPKSLS